MGVTAATLRRAAWAMPIAYVSIGAAALALARANGTVQPDDVATFPAFLLYTVVGALVASRQPGNAIGWLLGAAGLSAVSTFASDQYAVLAARGGTALPGAGVAAWLSLWLWIGMLAPLLFTVMLFPSGRLPSPRWRPAAWVAGGVMAAVAAIFAFGSPATDVDPPIANPLWMPWLEPLYTVADQGFIIFVALLGMSVAALVTRFRRSRGVERQQLKWIVVAGVLMVATLALGLLGDTDGGSALWVVAILALPASIGVAMLRYRLYDVDVLINRTLVYGALTAALFGIYVASVLVLSAVLRPLTGSGDSAVAGSTLAVVALFAPLRRRFQDLVDRQFYRSRYDAARTIDRFNARLRDQVDLDALSSELVGVVHGAVRPSHVSLWLRR